MIEIVYWCCNFTGKGKCVIIYIFTFYIIFHQEVPQHKNFFSPTTNEKVLNIKASNVKQITGNGVIKQNLNKLYTKYEATG